MSQILYRAVDKYQRDGLCALIKTAYKYHLKRKVGDKLINPPFDRFVSPTIYSRALNREQLINLTPTDKSLVSETETTIYCSSPSGNNSHPVFEDVVGKYPSQKLHICELSNTKLVGDKGILITDSGKFILESVKGGHSYLKNGIKSNPIKSALAANNINPYPTYRSESSSNDEFVATSLVDHTGKTNHYGHWLVEYLPMLFGLKKYEESTGIEPVIFVNPDPPQWMIDSLSLLGYERDRLVEWDNTIADIDTFVLPLTGHIAPEWEFAPKSRKWVGRKICENLPDQDQYHEERIFISRQSLNKRAIENVNEIMPVLDSYDITVVHPESMGFHEQVSLYASCDLLIGPSGSGLHNMVFADEATVFELFHPDHVTTYNYRLAESFENEYRFLLGTGSDAEPGRPVKDQCFSISPSALRDSLENWLVDHKNRT